MTKFVLLSTQRSGSTWVIDALDSHPEVKAFEELFLEGKKRLVWAGAQDAQPWHAYWTSQGTAMASVLRPWYHFRYLDSIYSAEKDRCRAVGFKLMYGQLRQHPAIFAYMLLRRVSVIHLIRENSLDVILSHEARKKRRVAHAYGEVSAVKVHLETSSLLQRLNHQESKVRWAKRVVSHTRLPYFEVAYEDLVYDGRQFSGVLEFLSVSRNHSKLATSLNKLNKSSHIELIENYEDVQYVLAGTKYEHLLH